MKTISQNPTCGTLV